MLPMVARTPSTSLTALAEEATYINHNFTNQVVIENESSKVAMSP